MASLISYGNIVFLGIDLHIFYAKLCFFEKIKFLYKKLCIGAIKLRKTDDIINERKQAAGIFLNFLCKAADLQGRLAFVMGNEANGVSPALLAVADKRVFIPMQGRAESLNVAMAAGIVMFEALRQKLK